MIQNGTPPLSHTSMVFSSVSGPSCPKTLLASIHDPESIRAILRHLGLLIEPPSVAHAKPPPQTRRPW